MDADKTRVQFDLGQEALDQVEELQADLDGMTRAELFRTAIRLYRWLHKKRSDGWSIHIKKGRKDLEVKIPLPGL